MENKEIAEKNSCCSEKDRGCNFGGLFFGIILIFAGFVYLGGTTGLFNIDVDLWRFWPVLIILTGLSMISGRGWVSTALRTIVVLAVLGMIGFIVLRGADVGKDVIFGRQIINIEKEQKTESVVINLKLGAAGINVSGGGNNLVSGNFESNCSKLITESGREGNVQKIILKTTDNWTVFGSKRAVLDLKINPGILVTLNIETGAADVDLDLSEVMAKDIDIDIGASNLDIVLGDKVETAKMNIDAGASSVKIILPKTLGAAVRLDTGLSSKNLTAFREITPSLYQSDDYETSQKKIDIDLNLGVSSLDINWK